MSRLARRSARTRRPGLGLAKKLLLSAMIVGGVGGTVGSTYAIMTSETTNVASTFATGTLTLSNTANSGTACLSASATSAPSSSPPSVDCAAVISATDGPWYPGQSTTATVKVTNDGSLDASSLSVYMANGCSSQGVTGVYQGGGNPCGSIEVYLQETDAAGNPVRCFFPAGEGSTCAFTTAGTLTNFYYGAFASFYPLHLPGGLQAGATRYFTIGLELPTWAPSTSGTSGAGNPYQGEQADFALTWYATY